MSISAVSSAGKTKQSNSNSSIMQLLLSLLSGQSGTGLQGLNSIFDTTGNSNLSSLLGANSNSIFGTNATGSNGTLLSNFQPTTAKEESMIANLYSSSVNSVLGMKIPPLPTKDAAAKAA
jgi:hypothetical protein